VTTFNIQLVQQNDVGSTSLSPTTIIIALTMPCQNINAEYVRIRLFIQISYILEDLFLLKLSNSMRPLVYQLPMRQIAGGFLESKGNCVLWLDYIWMAHAHTGSSQMVVWHFSGTM
jgi:hypothetical protein